MNYTFDDSTMTITMTLESFHRIERELVWLRNVRDTINKTHPGIWKGAECDTRIRLESLAVKSQECSAYTETVALKGCCHNKSPESDDSAVEEK